jgi:predicted nucleic acid-binding protein
MQKVELVVDGDVVSYIFRRRALGNAYSQLIGLRRTGITLLAVGESRQGVVYDNWGDRRIAALHAFLSRFFILEANTEIANVCGGLLGRCMQIGLAISWPDAWAAVTALWLDVPLVTHDRDLEKVPGLRVLTVHADWQVREEGSGIGMGGPLWLGERDAWRRHVPARAEPGASRSNEPVLTHIKSYSEVRWRWPDDFNGFEEFVTESRKESGYGREPPPWW